MAKYKAKQSTNWGQTSEKIKKVKEPKTYSESEKEVRGLIITLIVIVLIVVAIYLVSKVIVNNRDNSNGNETVTGQIDYSKVNVGMILNRPYEEYYVIVYDSELPEAVYYSSLISRYDAKEEAKKIYYCDLGNPLNEVYVADVSNPDAQKTDQFAFTGLTLLRIKDGKIVDYIEDITEIEKLLK